VRNAGSSLVTSHLVPWLIQAGVEEFGSNPVLVMALRQGSLILITMVESNDLLDCLRLHVVLS